MSIFKKLGEGFLAKLFKNKQVEELAEELARTYADEMQADMLSDNPKTDTAEDTAAEPVPMLEVTELGEVDFTEPPETTKGESPPQDTEPSEVRKHILTFRVNDEELEAINRRYAETSFRSRGDFCRYSALEELESAAHKALAEFMVMSTPQMELSDRIHELEKQIPAIEEYCKYKVYYKNYTSLEGKSKKKYGENYRYELDQYHECRKKLKELFPDGIIPKIKDLQDELKKAREDYAKMSAECTAYKKEADRLSRLARQKRDSQKTIQRYLQNEQTAKRKKVSLNKKISKESDSPCRGGVYSYLEKTDFNV